MKYRIGEFVRFVEEKREGTITRIIDDLMIAVTDNDGFEIPVLASQVTRIHGQPWEPADEVTTAHDSAKEFKKSGIFLSLTADPLNAVVAHFHILNKTSYHLLGTLNSVTGSKFRCDFNGRVAPESKSKIFSASLNEVDRWPKFFIQLLLHTTEGDELKQPLTFEKKFQGRDLSTAKEPLEIVDEKGWLFRIDSDTEAVDLSQLKQRFGSI